MTAATFLDTNILVYAVASDDPRHEMAIAVQQEGGTISVQVLNEFANVLQRKLKWDWPDTEAALAAVRKLCPTPRPLTLATHERAIGLAAKAGFAFYDALIVASALDAGCTTLLSEDMQDGQVIEGRLTIRNPFKPAT